jgi:hypothetical protein
MISTPKISALLFLFLISVLAGCDSINNTDPQNLQLTIAANPETVLIGEYSTITASLNSLEGTTSSASGTVSTTAVPVTGYPVVFSISQNNTQSTLTVVSSTTDGSGKAVAFYKAGGIAGLDVVQVSIDDGKSASVGIKVTLDALQTTKPQNKG